MKLEQIIKDTERIIDEHMDDLASLNCEATITYTGGDYNMRFYTGFEGIEASVDKKGNYQIELIE